MIRQLLPSLCHFVLTLCHDHVWMCNGITGLKSLFTSLNQVENRMIIGAWDYFEMGIQTYHSLYGFLILC